ncbi:hypothetical protein Bca52824_022640 [Brassica carinata]|uniref:Uncharacterized protein n=1 Tax=Brassica carinata TaxID=52824 RepID=A0A8X7VH43_BRACI|nr:hypothetical protein Bca52824_022640 [Brassica carinata]
MGNYGRSSSLLSAIPSVTPTRRFWRSPLRRRLRKSDRFSLVQRRVLLLTLRLFVSSTVEASLSAQTISVQRMDNEETMNLNEEDYMSGDKLNSDGDDDEAAAAAEDSLMSTAENHVKRGALGRRDQSDFNLNLTVSEMVGVKS